MCIPVTGPGAWHGRLPSQVHEAAELPKAGGREEGEEEKEENVFLSHVNADPITSLSTRCLCHHTVINNDACSLKPAVLCANGRRRGGEGEEKPSSFFAGSPPSSYCDRPLKGSLCMNWNIMLSWALKFWLC